jgi:hypothetical protein
MKSGCRSTDSLIFFWIGLSWAGSLICFAYSLLRDEKFILSLDFVLLAFKTTA